MINCLPYVPLPGMEPATQVCALTRNQTCDFSVEVMMLQPTEPYRPGSSIYLYLFEFLQCVKVFRIQVFYLLGQNYSQVVMFFNAIESVIAFLIFPFDCLLLVLRNETDFCILILYQASLLNSLLALIFFWWSLGLFICSIMSSTNNKAFTSFLIQMPFIYFFLSMDRISVFSIFRKDAQRKAYMLIILKFISVESVGT